MLKIWGRINSSNVRKVLWCAEELGLNYQQVDAGGAFGVVNTSEYRAMNPNGRVPVLQDGDLTLYESNTICRYLLATHAAGSHWWPEQPAARARAELWMDWATASLAAPFKDVFWGVLRTPPAEQNWPAIFAARDACAELLAQADALLARQAYLSGEQIGMGDIPLGCVAYGWFGMPIERQPLAHLEAWYARLCERPAYRRAVMTALT